MRSPVRENAHFLADGFTLYRVFVSLMVIYGAFHGMRVREFGFLVISGMLSDIFDGVLARKYGGTYLGSLDYPADLSLVVSIMVFLLKKHFLPVLHYAVFTLFLFFLFLIFKNDSPLAFWMGAGYAAFITYVFIKDRLSFWAGIVTIIVSVGINPRRAWEKITGFLRDVKRGLSRE